MNKKMKITLACLTLLGLGAPIYSRFRPGQFFGGMAAGGLIGGLIGSRKGRRDAQREYYQQPTYQAVPAQDRVVYVRDIGQDSQSEVARLQQQNQELQQQLQRLERQQMIAR